MDPYESKFSLSSGSSPLSSLFFEASHLTRSTPIQSIPSQLQQDAAPAEEDSIPTIVHQASQQQEKLKTELLLKIPDCVRLAASKGLLSTNILTFHGNDKFQQEFSYLFLLKGPRNREQRDLLSAAGFVPLLDTLRSECNPFEVRHTWMPGTNENHVTLFWK